MLSIIIGLTCMVGGSVLTMIYNNSFLMTIFLVGVIICILCTNRPLSGWERLEPPYKEYKLVPITSDKNMYVIESDDGTLMCMYKTKDGEVVKSCSCCNTVYTEISEGEMPTLKVYELRAKKTLWAFPIGVTKYERCLYIPKDSVIKSNI